MLLLLLAAGLALSPTPAPAGTEPEPPTFQRARVDLAALGAYGTPAPPVPEAPEDHEATEATGALPGTGAGSETLPTDEHEDGDDHGDHEGVVFGVEQPSLVAENRPGPGWRADAELPIAGQFVVVEWEGDPHAAFSVRSRNRGTWTDWVFAHSDVDERPDASEPGNGLNAVGPIWIGEGAEAFEVAIQEGVPDDLSLLVMRSVEPAGWSQNRRSAPSSPSTGIPSTATGPTASATASPANASLPAQPTIWPRSTWGAGPWAYANSGCEKGPIIADDLRFGVVHHSVSTNSYTTSQADDQIRAIYDYHVNSRGWCDIAYNFVVDRFGTIWEGRTQSLSAPVQGGHASGFNSGSMGVVLLGQHHPGASPTAATVTSATRNSLKNLLGWRFGLYGIDPTGTTLEISGGSSSIPEGQWVNVATISGHRDLGATGCPGDYAYVLLPQLRTDVAAMLVGVPLPPVRPALGRNADGRMEIFATDASGRIRHAWQSVPGGGPWLGWPTLSSGPWTGGPAISINRDGRQEIFMRDAAGRIHHTWQTAPNGLWHATESMGGSARSDPAAGINADGRLEVFTLGTDGAIRHAWQWAPGGNWSLWSTLGGRFSNAPAVGSNADDRQEVVVVGDDGQLWHAWQWKPNSSWSGWYPMGGSLKGDPATGSNADGRFELFALGRDGQLWHNWQWKPNGTTGWSGWHAMGKPSVGLAGGPTVNRNPDGRLEVFAFGNDGRLWHTWQWFPNGHWSPWQSLSPVLR